ncbi:hypothetical protein HY627_02500 [Candidatus Uhrbacteria bacterium]|nr:hypothetical protein [Candidatus Uhrbacteria bacterium]
MPDTTQKQKQFELPPYEHIPEAELERETPDAEKPKASPTRVEEQPTVVIPTPSSPSVAAPVIMEEKTQMRRDIERILEENVGDIYLTLNKKQRSQFRIEGEKTAAKIEVILQQAKVKLMSLVKLIRAWLLLLPGVNRFFLEQEAKIKAEKLLILRTADD